MELDKFHFGFVLSMPRKDKQCVDNLTGGYLLQMGHGTPSNSCATKVRAGNLLETMVRPILSELKTKMLKDKQNVQKI